MDILIKPIVTEKMTDQSEKLNRYGFVVRKEADKEQIKQAVQELYNVSVLSVNPMVYGGKNKSRYTKAGVIKGSTSAWKKAVITLVDGDTIDFYSNI